jgi:drug/metabolite transporter (DMT)-like permease
MNIKLKALVALTIPIFLWSSMVVVARVTVETIHPLTLLFSRLFFAALPFFPFLLKSKPWKRKFFSSLLMMSFLTTINFTFFLLGIQYTSASASQLIYAAVPVLILILNITIFRETHAARKILGVLIGFLGLMLIIYLSAIEKGTTITGSLMGNLLVIIGMVSWVFYLLMSKRIQKYFTPVEIGGISIVVSFLVSIPLFLFEVFVLNLHSKIDPNGIFAVFFMGFFGTFLSYLFYLHGLSYVSALTASFTSYIQPIVTAILEIILLGEKLTLGFISGSGLVFIGVFLATTLEFLHRRNNK